MNLKQIAIGSLLATAGFAAMATPIDPVIDMTTGSGSFEGMVAAGAVSAIDTFTFTLSTPVVDLVSSVITFKNATRDIDFTSITLSGGSIVGSASYTNSSPDPLESWGLSLPALSAGNYTLKLAYDKTGSRAASYSGTFEVTPVPEPETYAMMLAGLGAIGFMARRRRPQA